MSMPSSRARARYTATAAYVYGERPRSAFSMKRDRTSRSSKGGVSRLGQGDQIGRRSGQRDLDEVLLDAIEEHDRRRRVGASEAERAVRHVQIVEAPELHDTHRALRAARDGFAKLDGGTKRAPLDALADGVVTAEFARSFLERACRFFATEGTLAAWSLAQCRGPPSGEGR